VRVSYTVARPERVPLAIRVATGPFALRGVSTRTSLPATVDPKAPATRRATVRFFT
jgi:hypothetical protein